MHAAQTVRAEGMERTAVHHLTAPAADLVDAALDNEQIARLIFDQDTRAAAIVVKRQLVQLGMLHLKPIQPCIPAREGAIAQNCPVQMIFHAGGVPAAQIGEFQHPLALVAQNVQIVFEQYGVSGQRAGLVHT